MTADDTEKAATQGTLANQFLIAMPALQDPWFANTVSYMWKHNEEGALGIVINKPSSLRIAELMQEMNIDISAREGDANFHKQYVMNGGPVESNKGFILHDGDLQWEYTLPITNKLSVTMSKDILEDIAADKGPKQYLVTMGCAGWDAGQLENEITENSWLTVPATADLIFLSDHSKKAEAAASILGISLSQLSSFAGHS